MVSGARYLYLAMVWIYLAAVVFQVFLAGAALFGTAKDFEPHVGLGWILHLVPVLLLIVAAVGRVGSRLLWWTTALLLVQFVQPILATVRNDLPLVAAFHPVLALIIFWLAFTIGLKAWRLIQQAALSQPEP
jgi:putative tricarboxylic transport membrane protein